VAVDVEYVAKVKPNYHLVTFISGKCQLDA